MHKRVEVKLNYRKQYKGFISGSYLKCITSTINQSFSTQRDFWNHFQFKFNCYKGGCFSLYIQNLHLNKSWHTFMHLPHVYIKVLCSLACKPCLHKFWQAWNAATSLYIYLWYTTLKVNFQSKSNLLYDKVR